jgi:hypothetical protein
MEAETMIEMIAIVAQAIAIFGLLWLIRRQNRTIGRLLAALNGATATMEKQNSTIELQDKTITSQSEVIENWIAWSEGRQPDHTGRLN